MGTKVFMIRWEGIGCRLSVDSIRVIRLIRVNPRFNNELFPGLDRIAGKGIHKESRDD